LEDSVKRIHVVLLLLACCANPSLAAEIEGKWGVGAGLFNGGGEATLMRGLSERTLLGISLSASRAETDIEGGLSIFLRDERSWSLSMGPRLRRFTRVGADLSPYWDLFVNGLASEFRGNLGFGDELRLTSYGVGAGLAFGIEWETPWTVSVAVHSDVVRASWERVKGERNSFGEPSDDEGNRFFTSIGISPGLFARIYF
jgi:hypothetical protein